MKVKRILWPELRNHDTVALARARIRITPSNRIHLLTTLSFTNVFLRGEGLASNIKGHQPIIGQFCPENIMKGSSLAILKEGPTH